jgi:hypothetical protein
MPLYVLGRQLQDFFPVAFLPDEHALAVAIMSYNGNIDFGLLADYDAMPDLDRLTEQLETAREELVAAAQGRAAATAARRHAPRAAGRRRDGATAGSREA